MLSSFAKISVGYNLLFCSVRNFWTLRPKSSKMGWCCCIWFVVL